MKTAEGVDMEKKEAKEIMEVEEVVIEVQKDIALTMKITMTKIIMKETMMMIMTKKMKAEAAGEEAVAEAQVVVPAGDLAQ